MRTHHFFDIEILSCEEAPSPFIAAQTVYSLHCAGLPGQYALAFPGLVSQSDQPGKLGQRIRVFGFGQERGTLERLQDHLAEQPIDDYIKVRRISDAPQNPERYAAYLGIKPKATPSRIARRSGRIEQGKSDRPEYCDDDLIQIFERQTKLSEHPFLRLRSLSTKTQFRIYVRKEQITNPPDSNAKPNSYGFSSASNIIALPDF